jgi:hypothetical protein
MFGYGVDYMVPQIVSKDIQLCRSTIRRVCFKDSATYLIIYDGFLGGICRIPHLARARPVLRLC